MADIWTVRSCLDWTRDYLAKHGEERPGLAAEWLLCAATDMDSRTTLYMSFDRPLTEDELNLMHKSVVRRAKGEPLQYITGSTQFRSINVACAPGVLIPRPETEMLVETVLEYLDEHVLAGAPALERAQLPWNAEVEAALESELKEAAERKQAEQKAAAGVSAAEEAELAGDVMGARAYAEELAEREEDERAYEDQIDAAADEAAADEAATQEGAAEPEGPAAARVLEVGCGTGCISLSIAKERAGRAFCYATDIEPRAIELATKNRDALGLTENEVFLSLTNLVSSVPRDAWGTFDVLVSNPPYIPSEVMGELPSEVSNFEPALALDGGDDGLDIYRRLVKAAPHMLRPSGFFACELFEEACEPAAELCREAGFENVRIVDDLTGRPRIVAAQMPAEPLAE